MELKNNEYSPLYDETCINNFIYYKLCTCIENQFDILVDYGLINENMYNKLIYKLMKKTYQINPSKQNNNINNLSNTIPLNEDDDLNTENIFTKIQKLRNEAFKKYDINRTNNILS